MAGRGGNFCQDSSVQAKELPSSGVSFPLLEEAHDWGPKWIVHYSCFLRPTNSLPAPMSEGKGLTTRINVGEAENA